MIVARLKLLFILQNALSYIVFPVPFLTALKLSASGRIQETYRFIRSSKTREVDYGKENVQPFRGVITIKKLLGITDIIAYRTNNYLLNAHIELNTWNKVYAFDDDHDDEVKNDRGSE